MDGWAPPGSDGSLHCCCPGGDEEGGLAALPMMQAVQAGCSGGAARDAGRVLSSLQEIQLCGRVLR